MFTVDQAAKLYGVPLIDYQRDGDGDGVLVSSGCGLMMAVMDAVPDFRWCVDYDSLPTAARLVDFLLIAERATSMLAVCGWFSLTNPEPLRNAIAALSRMPICYGGNLRLTSLSTEPTSLGEFLAKLTEQSDVQTQRKARACR